MTTVSDPAVSQSNIDFVSHSDQGGRGDGVQIVVYNGHAYIGHMFSNGVTVMDVRDAKQPQPVHFIPAPPNTWNLHLQTADDLLLVVNAANLFAAVTDEKAYYGGSITQCLLRRSRNFTLGCAFSTFPIRPTHASVASCPSAAWACIGSGTPAGRTPTSPPNSRALPITSSWSSMCPTRPDHTRSGVGGCRGCGRPAAKRRLGTPANIATLCTTPSSPTTSRTAPGVTAASRCSTSATHGSRDC